MLLTLAGCKKILGDVYHEFLSFYLVDWMMPLPSFKNVLANDQEATREQQKIMVETAAVAEKKVEQMID